MIRILIIDDHLITRLGLKLLLKEILPAHQVDETDSGAEALELLKKKEYDICLLDLNIPKTDTMDLLRQVRNYPNPVKVLVVSMNNEDVYALNVMKYGAMGFISKANGYDEIKAAILKVLNGKKYMSEKVISFLIETETERLEVNPFGRLSERELEIAKLICEGFPTKAIALKTSLQLSTISTYKSKIFEKLQVKNTIELFELSVVHKLLKS